MSSTRLRHLWLQLRDSTCFPIARRCVQSSRSAKRPSYYHVLLYPSEPNCQHHTLDTWWFSPSTFLLVGSCHLHCRSLHLDTLQKACTCVQDSQNSPGTHHERKLDALFPLHAMCCKLYSLATPCAPPSSSVQGLIHTPSQMSDPHPSFWKLTSHCS